MKLLHIVASPRRDASTTLVVTAALLRELARHTRDLDIETLDLFGAEHPAASGTAIQAKYSSSRTVVAAGGAAPQTPLERAIDDFRSADAYIVSAPMWNLGVPYALKHYLDCIVQPGDLFRADEHGIPRTLLEGKRMLVVSSSGSDYREESPLFAFDFFEPYLRAIFGFVGITDIRFIRAHGVDVSPQLRRVAIDDAISEATALASERWLEMPST